MADLRVAKRKTHSKSRKGCSQCKQRHTKCNEARPRCANCIRLDIQCSWPTVPNTYSTPSQASPADHVSPFAEPEPSGSPDTASRAFELSIPDLRLVHHWTSKGYNSLHPTGTRSDAWQTGFIELGFEHPFLLHGLLALSAAHKASFLLPAERQSLLLQADSHISRALDTYRKNLEASNDETPTIPMFILSSVLLTYNFGIAQEKPEDPIGSLHHCFMLLQGIKVVVLPHWDRIKDNDVFALMTDMSSPSTLEMLDSLARDDKSQEIIRLKELTELLLDTQDKEACADAIDQLHATWLRFRHLTHDRDEYGLLFLWPAKLNNRFFDLLAAHNPVTCIITTHFATILAQGRPIWWVSKWPVWLLDASEELLRATPDLLRWLDWPQQIIRSRAWSQAATPVSC
ncbi:uncharacterized protein K460DRAFT_271541 [Cucurbitaria berberidis CBS 394.84]|uniref:Zn(2)-C6 fungal-type domain-containing protein n=1 Tax=Cucurbitaria berberidis CBS 394.84 TaxID=1168544 RepID=A0A9P4GRN3_9PLEO|nr:uncharacterized protein K460DRAFT_271541 [Cucurbitaria berberidis CBS 394.84]KAF1850500.1 hypothetical protein K460DRAFT_271541 [Cucurbitaria berberidis CBS 394.84]